MSLFINVSIHTYCNYIAKLNTTVLQKAVNGYENGRISPQCKKSNALEGLDEGQLLYGWPQTIKIRGNHKNVKGFLSQIFHRSFKFSLHIII